MKRIVLVVFLGALIVITGCLGGSQPTETDGTEETENEIRYVNESSRSRLEIIGDKSTQTFDLHFEFYENLSSEQFTPREETNLTLRVGCSYLSKIAYNYSATEQSEQDNPEADSDFPENMVKNYSPNEVTVEVWNQDRSEKYGECTATGEGEYDQRIDA